MDISELENALDTLREDELERALTEKKEEMKRLLPIPRTVGKAPLRVTGDG